MTEAEPAHFGRWTLTEGGWRFSGFTSTVVRMSTMSQYTVASQAKRRIVEVAEELAQRHGMMPPPNKRPLQNLRAVVLLGGTVRPTALRSSIGRSVMDLPVRNGETLLDRWRGECLQMVVAMGLRSLAVRLVVDRASPAISRGWMADPRVILAVEQDPVEYRGTGGVIADLARGYDPHDYLLIGNAAQILRSSLSSLATELAGDGADVTVISHTDGTPSGLMLARCSAFGEVSRVGFVDLKEQALPAIARRHRVQVIEHERPIGLVVRTLGDYIGALRRYHGDLAGVSESLADLEDWNPQFSLVEEGTNVHPTARIHDSVVLGGAVVEENAVVVRSVICGGGRVRRGQMAIDQLVTPPERRRR